MDRIIFHNILFLFQNILLLLILSLYNSGTSKKEVQDLILLYDYFNQKFLKIFQQNIYNNYLHF